MHEIESPTTQECPLKRSKEKILEDNNIVILKVAHLAAFFILGSSCLLMLKKVNITKR